MRYASQPCAVAESMFTRTRWMTLLLPVHQTALASSRLHVSSVRSSAAHSAHYPVVNYPEPGKRPLSSTVPTIMENEDGTFYLAIGGSGGSRIFPAVFQVMLNLDWGMDVSGAIEYGRLHDQLYPTILDADNIIPTETLDVLREKGHNVTGKGLDLFLVSMSTDAPL